MRTYLVKVDKIDLNTGPFKGRGYNSRATFNGAGAVNQIELGKIG